jgi:hypothetical protein
MAGGRIGTGCNCERSSCVNRCKPCLTVKLHASAYYIGPRIVVTVPPKLTRRQIHAVRQGGLALRAPYDDCGR